MSRSAAWPTDANTVLRLWVKSVAGASRNGVHAGTLQDLCRPGGRMFAFYRRNSTDGVAKRDLGYLS